MASAPFAYAIVAPVPAGLTLVSALLAAWLLLAHTGFMTRQVTNYSGVFLPRMSASISAAVLIAAAAGGAEVALCLLLSSIPVHLAAAWTVLRDRRFLELTGVVLQAMAHFDFWCAAALRLA